MREEFLDRSAGIESSATAQQELHGAAARLLARDHGLCLPQPSPPRTTQAARRIEPVEEVVDDLVATLRANHIRRVRDGQCTVYAGLAFLDILVNAERIADQCSNLGVYAVLRSSMRLRS